MKHKRTKATSIPSGVKKAVEERDHGCCIFCGKPNSKGECHVIGRAQGGMGVEKNIICACWSCHSKMDNSQARNIYVNKAKEYLKAIYPDWNEKDLIYNKWKGFKYQ